MARPPIDADERKRRRREQAKTHRNKRLQKIQEQYHQECQQNPFIRLIGRRPPLPVHDNNDDASPNQETLADRPSSIPTTEAAPTRNGSHHLPAARPLQPPRRRSPRLPGPTPPPAGASEATLVDGTISPDPSLAERTRSSRPDEHRHSQSALARSQQPPARLCHHTTGPGQTRTASSSKGERNTKLRESSIPGFANLTLRDTSSVFASPPLESDLGSRPEPESDVGSEYAPISLDSSSGSIASCVLEDSLLNDEELTARPLTPAASEPSISHLSLSTSSSRSGSPRPSPSSAGRAPPDFYSTTLQPSSPGPSSSALAYQVFKSGTRPIPASAPITYPQPSLSTTTSGTGPIPKIHLIS